MLSATFCSISIIPYSLYVITYNLSCIPLSFYPLILYCLYLIPYRFFLNPYQLSLILIQQPPDLPTYLEHFYKMKLLGFEMTDQSGSQICFANKSHKISLNLVFCPVFQDIRSILPKILKYLNMSATHQTKKRTEFQKGFLYSCSNYYIGFKCSNQQSGAYYKAQAQLQYRHICGVARQNQLYVMLITS